MNDFVVNFCTSRVFLILSGSNTVIHNVIKSQSFKAPYVFEFPAVQINHVGKYECVYDVVAMPLELTCLSKPTHFTVMRMSYIKSLTFIKVIIILMSAFSHLRRQLSYSGQNRETCVHPGSVEFESHVGHVHWGTE